MATAVKARQYDGIRGGWVEYGFVSINPASIAAGAEGSPTATLTGAKTGDIVIVQAPSDLEADLFPKGAKITAADTLTVTIGNEGAGAVDGVALDWGYILVHLS